MKKLCLWVLFAVIACLPVRAGLVEVQLDGTVEYNQVRAPASFNRDVVHAGDSVHVRFLLDSNDFLDSSNFPVRGYVVIPDSYSIEFGAATGPVVAHFPNPYPGGTPYFVVRNNDPRVDGFYVSTGNVDYPFQYLFVDQPARFEPYFEQTFEVSYPEDRLPSLDIYDAVGLYDYTGLSVYYFTMLDAFADAMSIEYTQMTISRVPIEVPVDFRPGGCPNPLNVYSKGVLPVAILGTSELDAATIDPASIRLNGVAPIMSHLEDAGTPFEPYTGKTSCTMDCNDYGRDGVMDLVLQFDTEEAVAAMGNPANGTCSVLTLTGNLYQEFDGAAPISGEDVALILNHGGISTLPTPVVGSDRLQTRSATGTQGTRFGLAH